ncbi:MAG: hypothetical protein Q8O10_04780 [candidate division Zixibacteria bacterium]|nr:hypothetical protein [candidate division Zixibacteria bacterium]
MSYKRFKIAGLVLMVMILFFSWAKAETLVTKEETAPSIDGYFNLMNYQSSQELYSLTQTDSAGMQKLNMDVYQFKNKSTKRGFLYSLVVPGAGEFYAGSKIKAVLFFGLEAGFWTGYFSYHKKGKNKEKEFLNFADAHWNEQYYRDSLLSLYGVVVDTPGVYYGRGDSIVISHTLPSSKDQQYYEMIGKYDQFRFGWDDFAGALSTFNRDIYLGMRHDSNSLLDKANRFVMFSIANHLLSAFDAALSVRSHNRKGEKFSQVDLKIRLTEYNGNEIIPKFTVSTKF